MVSLRGSLDGLGFPALRQLLAKAEKNGCLYIWFGTHTARVYFVVGQIVGATVDLEYEYVPGLEASEANAREFVFAEREELGELIPAESTRSALRWLERQGPRPREGGSASSIVSAIPCHTASEELTDESVTVEIELRALHMLAAVDGQRTVYELADRHDLAQTLRDLARLLDLGVIRLEFPTDAVPSNGLSAASSRMQPPRATQAHPNAPQARLHCPMLGFVDDPDHIASGPSLLHRCFASGDAEQLSSREQSELCFTEQFALCPRLREPCSLPPPACETESPTEVSERPLGLRRLLHALGLVESQTA